MQMRAWYDIISLDRDGPSDEDGIRQSGAILQELIDKEIQRGIPANRIIVAGFSQGGAIAIHAALRCTEKLGGLMALSTYLPLPEVFDAEVVNNAELNNKDLPIFMAHGSFDPVLPLQLGQASYAQLSGAGFDVEWHEYPMAHAVSAEEIRDIRTWLLSVYE
jgi:phospholipase/carboxylesterase